MVRAEWEQRGEGARGPNETGNVDNKFSTAVELRSELLYFTHTQLNFTYGYPVQTVSDYFILYPVTYAEYVSANQV